MARPRKYVIKLTEDEYKELKSIIQADCPAGVAFQDWPAGKLNKPGFHAPVNLAPCII